MGRGRTDDDWNAGSSADTTLRGSMEQNSHAIRSLAPSAHGTDGTSPRKSPAACIWRYVNRVIPLETLTAQHDISQFRCGNSALDNYLRREALKEQQNHFARVFVAVDPDADGKRAIGYLSLSATGYYIPGSANRSHSDTFLYPVFLAFLARDSAWRGKGLGDFLLVEALKQAAAAAEHIGLPDILLRTTKEGTSLYERFGFVWIDRDDDYLYLPMGEACRIASSAERSEK
jgi:ribosomal protein S18 acetylase RimI-like enzyme